MVELLDLWMPILVSSVLVFVASSVIHMALPWHKGDYKGIPNEEAVLESVRGHQVPPGEYMFPHAESMKECGTPEYTAKLERGPVGTMIVLPNGPWTMGKSLGQWFGYTLVVSVFVAYICSLALDPGVDYMKVFQVAGAVALLGYGFHNVTTSIWKGGSWATTTRFFVDGLLYSLVTAGVFGWRWPGA